MPKMIIELNYLIAFIAYTASFVLCKKGSQFKNASLFMFFFASAALLGGLVHHAELYKAYCISMLVQFNAKLPAYIHPFSFEMILDRLWFLTIESIGFAEFFFMYVFIEPVASGRLSFIKNYLKAVLALYCLVTLLSTQYIFVIAFHVMSHAVIILFALFLYFSKHMKPLLWLALLCIYNLVIGIVQQLMSVGKWSSGMLHYNDWYHIGVIIFVISAYLIITKSKLIDTLERAHKKK